MRVRATAAGAALALVAAATFSAASTAGAQGRPDNPGSAADHWTPERREAAIPRDLVIDEHGQSYLRRPDGTLEPYGKGNGSPTTPGNQLQAQSPPAPTAKPGGEGGGSDDSTPPVITNLDPAGITIPSTYTFTADVTDIGGVRSVTFVIVYPDGRTQSIAASLSEGSTYRVGIGGFTAGNWSWYVVAKDTAKRGGGNTATSDPASFTVGDEGGGGDGGDGGGGDDGGGGGGDQVVTNSPWNKGGAVQTAAGRLYFEMPTRGKRWAGYVCSGTTVTDDASGRSIILTAAHCVYDDANKAFARHVLFIPDQAATTGSGTDRDCSNDTYGCWEPSFGVVDSDWATRTWPDNIPWDYGFYVVSDAGAHSGNGVGGALDGLPEGTLPISFNTPTPGTSTAALGYSYSDDPNFMHCQEGLGTEGPANWFLPTCGLSGGASGGPWLQPVSNGYGPIVSVNSYGYSTKPGMGGPKLSDSSASCLFMAARAAALTSVGTTPSNC